MELSGGSRVVHDGSENVDKAPTAEPNSRIIDVAKAMTRNGQVFEPLIATAESRDGGHILVEGHTRATAYVRARYTGSVEVIVSSFIR